MKRTLFEFNALKILEEDGRYFALYDAGAHQVVLRKDEISKDDALFASAGRDNAVKMLGNLQKRLIDSGIDPYLSNIPDPE